MRYLCKKSNTNPMRNTVHIPRHRPEVIRTSAAYTASFRMWRGLPLTHRQSCLIEILERLRHSAARQPRVFINDPADRYLSLIADYVRYLDHLYPMTRALLMDTTLKQARATAPSLRLIHASARRPQAVRGYSIHRAALLHCDRYPLTRMNWGFDNALAAVVSSIPTAPGSFVIVHGDYRKNTAFRHAFIHYASVKGDDAAFLALDLATPADYRPMRRKIPSGSLPEITFEECLPPLTDEYYLLRDYGEYRRLAFYEYDRRLAAEKERQRRIKEQRREALKKTPRDPVIHPLNFKVLPRQTEDDTFHRQAALPQKTYGYGAPCHQTLPAPAAAHDAVPPGSVTVIIPAPRLRQQALSC